MGKWDDTDSDLEEDLRRRDARYEQYNQHPGAITTPVDNKISTTVPGRSSGPHLQFGTSGGKVGTYRLEVKMPVEETPENPVEGVTTGVTESNDVNHPLHYNQDPSGVECIQIVRHRNYNIGAAIKYLWRAGLKDDTKLIQDLEKAVWHIRDEIDRLEGHV